ncbi:hypothetical protein RBB50_011501 [Rhinocladiella similis]
MALREKTWTWRNFFMCYMISIGMTAMGYPSGVIGVTLAQPSFLLYMKFLDLEATPPGLTSDGEGLIGAMSGVYQAGAAINVIITSYVADRWGRKRAIHYNAFHAVLGGALVCAAQNPAMFIVGRLFAGAGAWGYLVVAPFYNAELAPPALRGFLVGLNGISLAIGYALGSYMGLAFHFVKSPEAQWRAPLGIALVFPVIMSAICFVVPESPRYLLMQGRVDEAREVVYKIHGSKTDIDQEFVREEFYQMTKQAEMDRESTPSYIEMFTRPTYRKRTLLTMGFGFFAQSTGILILASNGPKIYSELGYSTVKQLIFQCGWNTVGLLGTIIAAAIMDIFGRKPLVVAGMAGCCVCLVIEAAMVAAYAGEGTNKAGLEMGVAATYIFILFQTFSFDSAGLVMLGEIFPNHSRARGLALVIAVVALTDLVYLEVTDTAFAHIGWKYYLVFIVLSFIGIFYCYFLLPETKGIPLEEIGAIFGDPVAVYAEDLHVDHNTHQLVVDEHDIKSENRLTRITTEGDVEKRLPTDANRLQASVQHVNDVDAIDD